MGNQEIKLPEVSSIEGMTAEDMKLYITYIATLRHNQNRWFRLRNFDALHIAQEMERKLDEFNGAMLDPQPKLF